MANSRGSGTSRSPSSGFHSFLHPTLSSDSPSEVSTDEWALGFVQRFLVDLLKELSALVTARCLSAAYGEIRRLPEQYSLICLPIRPLLDLLDSCFEHHCVHAVSCEAAAMCIGRSGLDPKLLTDGSISRVFRARIPSNALQVLGGVI
jgi:hypothetical protein